MEGVIPYPQYQQLKKIRRAVYTIVIVFGLLNIFFPLTAYADIFGNYIPDVYDEITENINETNEILKQAFKFSRTSPYDIVNSIPEGENFNLANGIRSASKTVALVVATLLLMVEFFRKSINFEWSSKWENILIFLIKIIVIKQVVQNADTIIGYIYSMFDYINSITANPSFEFLPYGTPTNYEVTIKDSVIKELSKSWWEILTDPFTGDNEHTYYYTISKDAVKLFFPNATLPLRESFPDKDSFVDAFINPLGKPNFFATWEIAKRQPLFLILKAIAYIVFVVIIGRVFELTVYTIFAPLPLATFASETTHDIARNFLKNYIATVLQVAVIAMMFIVYAATDTYIIKHIGSHLWKINMVCLGALGLGVMRSGTWAKKICGIA